METGLSFLGVEEVTYFSKEELSEFLKEDNILLVGELDMPISEC